MAVQDDGTQAEVRGPAVPSLLVGMIADGRWRHPGDERMREVMPWFESPLDFLKDVEVMRWESRSLDLFADVEDLSEYFREKRGAVELPWLDVGLAFLIAVNRIPGDDVAVALDYRSGEPYVVASDF